MCVSGVTSLDRVRVDARRWDIPAHTLGLSLVKGLSVLLRRPAQDLPGLARSPTTVGFSASAQLQRVTTATARLRSATRRPLQKKQHADSVGTHICANIRALLNLERTMLCYMPRQCILLPGVMFERCPRRIQHTNLT